MKRRETEVTEEAEETTGAAVLAPIVEPQRQQYLPSGGWESTARFVNAIL